mmetsp:Transcript_82542/g.242182  ORF Transcript_82542/g.242182 Transcript_82542/m.242182 type:complete len:208 (-) Transcript_82542:849-1472(-)
MKVSVILMACSSKLSGSMGLDSGATEASCFLNCSRSKSRFLKTSTFTKASRSCTALPLFPEKASTKFFSTFSKVEGVTSVPRGAEGLGKLAGSKKHLENSSSSWKKSLPISSNSPWKLGSRTPRPGCGRPKQVTRWKISVSLSAVSFRPDTLEFNILSRCFLDISLHWSYPVPFSYHGQSLIKNSRCPKGASSLVMPEQAAWAKVVK